MSWVITPQQKIDADALAYLDLVEKADGQVLEADVRTAVINFVTGCKADNIWNAIKASCILAGARTLAGALVPLVGTAPTNFNFVSGDYNRKTGLLGDGSTKYLDSNRNNNAEPQDNQHLSGFGSETGAALTPSWLGTAADIGASKLSRSGFQVRNVAQNTAPTSAGFRAASRSEGLAFLIRHSGTTETRLRTSQPPLNAAITVFLEAGIYGDPRLAFYSIGESLDLALLDARVTTLVNALSAAIP